MPSSEVLGMCRGWGVPGGCFSKYPLTQVGPDMLRFLILIKKDGIPDRVNCQIL